jgi:hypothetical protein
LERLIAAVAVAVGALRAVRAALVLLAVLRELP